MSSEKLRKYEIPNGYSDIGILLKTPLCFDMLWKIFYRNNRILEHFFFHEMKVLLESNIWLYTIGVLVFRYKAYGEFNSENHVGFELESVFP